MNNTQTPKMVPTIGRKVHYWPNQAAIERYRFVSLDPKQPFDATVVFVHEVRPGRWELNLRVSDHGSEQEDMAKEVVSLLYVPLVNPGEQPPAKGHYCTWMEAQIKMAAERG